MQAQAIVSDQLPKSFPTYEEVLAMIEKTSRQMAETDRKISKLGNRFGELIEHLVAPNLMRKFNELGYNYTKCSRNIEIQEAESQNSITEIDIFLENGDIVMAIEIKAKPDKNDVNEHIERMEKLRKYADKRGDKRRFRGGIGAAILSKEMRDYILKNGFYLIEQTGDTVFINMPENFSPREW